MAVSIVDERSSLRPRRVRCLDGRPSPGATPLAHAAPLESLPRLLQWLSGNIGFHHIHHVGSRVPNYNLKRCHRSHSLFRGVEPVTLFSSFGASRFRFWDERLRRLLGFRHLKDLRRRTKGAGEKHSIA
jgi:fatty acid desaturase